MTELDEVQHSTLFEGLNSEQKQAVITTEGPVLVLAGAGSGKTKTLTHRIAYLLREKHVSPFSVLAVTFTNKAAGEMADRISKLLSGNENNRINLPFLGTFHSIGVKLLRREGHHIGLDPGFTIYDSDDQLSLIRTICQELAISPKQYSPQSIRSYISGAKNELMTAAAYRKFAHGYFQTLVCDVFARYEKALTSAQAVDFDDLIGLPVKLFSEHPEVLAKYQDLWRYIMIDEYQDTNKAQYEFVRLLAEKYRNIFVVGDDAQCILPGTIIATEHGEVPIEKIEVGSTLVAASGFGETGSFRVIEKTKRRHNGTIVSATTLGGRSLRLTPEHICYARLQPKENQWYVYLMYRADKGYRIGITRGIRNPGKREVNGLMVRANQERADKMWIIRTADSLVEARFYEEMLSVRYGIPKTLFYCLRREPMTMTQDYIDKLYESIDTRAKARDLMDDFFLYDEFPHFRPQGVTSELSEYYPGRCQAYLLQFGDSRLDTKLPWHAHRIRITTANKVIQERFTEATIAMRADKKSQRVETSRKHFGEAFTLAKHLSDAGEIDLCRLARLTQSDGNFAWQPASHFRVGMVIPILDGAIITTDEVKTVEFLPYEGDVYDLNIEHVNNFAANGVIVHNSIYGWRGANFRNILDFEKDYPDSTVIKLEQNYRSTQIILDASNAVIEHNTQRINKALWTEKGEGAPITVYQAEDGRDEAEFIMTEVVSLQRQGYRLGDMAILYRTNAQSRALEEICLNYTLPYRLVGAVRFYERKEVKDILAYLRFICNGKDEVSFERLLSVPPRGLGDKSFTDLKKVIVHGESESTLSPRIMKAWKPLELHFDRWRKLRDTISVTDLIDIVVKESGYEKFLLDGTPEGEARFENVKELKSVASRTEDLPTFLTEVALVSDVDGYNPDEDAITLMTLHSAKGLEFPVVFMVGMEEGLFPNLRSVMDPLELEEERRLCYVGITRAKDKLYCLHASSRLIYGSFQSNLPSRFINEIPEHLVDKI